MSLVDSVRTVLSKYADFSGRARRSELWWWALVVAVVGNVLFYVLGASAWERAMLNGDTASAAGGVGFAIYSLLTLAVILPNLAVQVRRLHDTGRSGAWWFIVFVPFAGVIMLIVWWATEGTRGANQYGPDPKA